MHFCRAARRHLGHMRFTTTTRVCERILTRKNQKKWRFYFLGFIWTDLVYLTWNRSKCDHDGLQSVTSPLSDENRRSSANISSSAGDKNMRACRGSQHICKLTLSLLAGVCVTCSIDFLVTSTDSSICEEDIFPSFSISRAFLPILMRYFAPLLCLFSDGFCYAECRTSISTLKGNVYCISP